MKANFRSVYSALFLLLCLQLIVPAGLIHSFCDHHDTEHPHFAFGLTISEEHHHCQVLELSLPPVLHCEEEPEQLHQAFFAIAYSCFHDEACHHSVEGEGIRGPPANYC